jgi:hypothetical protein
MIDNVKKILKGLKGSLLMVSIENQYIIDTVIKNKELNEVYFLERTKLFKRKNKDVKNVKIKKLKKKFKNKLDYMLCDINGINIDLNKVIYNTYNIIGKKIIFYGVYDEYDVDRVASMYKRYGCTCKKEMYKDGFILEVNTSKIKVTKLFINKMGDLFKNIVEGIGNLLVS